MKHLSSRLKIALIAGLIGVLFAAVPATWSTAPGQSVSEATAKIFFIANFPTYTGTMLVMNAVGHWHFCIGTPNTPCPVFSDTHRMLDEAAGFALVLIFGFLSYGCVGLLGGYMYEKIRK